MSDTAQMFEDAIRWLRETYYDRPFFVERDVVYKVQLQLWQRIREHGLDWSVFNDYPMITSVSPAGDTVEIPTDRFDAGHYVATLDLEPGDWEFAVDDAAGEGGGFSSSFDTHLG